ncbi:DUF2169 domain-containing protein [Desulfosarcina sp.]|uniref:DUF2169 domain-containing protein n=1 Tax=Desulfosarcina sp. TaxID=2027861 RepID=UPI0039706223
MEIINDTPYSFGCIAGRIPFPGHSLTLIVKGTFDLVPDGDLVASQEQQMTTGDEFYKDDEEMKGGPRYASDFSYFKPRADLSLVGHCHAPKGTLASARRVTFQVGGRVHSLIVYGDRHWIGPVATDPEPFDKIPLRYEYSYGGSGFKNNPSGQGYDKQKDLKGTARRRLPNIMRPGEQMATPLSRLDPAGFGPLHREWDQRQLKLGSYTGKYLDTRWPWFAENMDWGYFNSSPDELQSDFLIGDETLYFENLHPDHPDYRSKLPGITIRCFVNRDETVSGAAHPFTEVPMKLDSLWVDMDAEKLVLVWRGWTPVADEEFEALRHTWIVSETLDQESESTSHYENRLQQRLQEENEKWEEDEPPEAPAPAIEDDTDKLFAAAEASYRQSMLDSGMNPDKPPQPSDEDKGREKRILDELGFGQEAAPAAEMTRETVVARFEATHNIAGLDLEGLDLSGVDFSGGSLQEAIFSNADLSNTRFDKADLTGAVFIKANLSGASFKRAELTDADLSEADCSHANLCKAILKDAVFDSARLTDARFEEADAGGASFIEADLTGATLVKATLTGADFSDSNLTKADLSGSNLAEATLDGAKCPGVIMDGADLTELRASEKCIFTGGSFKQVSAKESIWEAADLRDADFSLSKMEGANFTKANLTGARLRAVDMKYARFDKAILKKADLILANCLENSFEKADLSRCDCRQANLYGSEFLNALVDGTQFEGANLKMTKLVKR